MKRATAFVFPRRRDVWDWVLVTGERHAVHRSFDYTSKRGAKQSVKRYAKNLGITALAFEETRTIRRVGRVQA